jgi:hypothetical protein
MMNAPYLLAHERPERLRAMVVLAVRDVLEKRAEQEGVRGERDPEPCEPVLGETPRTLALKRRRGQPPGDQEEETQPEQPADAEHRGHQIDQASGHLVV